MQFFTHVSTTMSGGIVQQLQGDAFIHIIWKMLIIITLFLTLDSHLQSITVSQYNSNYLSYKLKISRFTSVKCAMSIFIIIAYTKKYLQSDWLRGVQYWPYLYSVFNICSLWLNEKENTTFEFRSGKMEMYSSKTT